MYGKSSILGKFKPETDVGADCWRENMKSFERRTGTASSRVQT